MSFINIRTKVIGVMIVLVISAGLTAAQESTDKARQPSLRVTGEATVMAKPDQAQIDIGVVTQAQTAQAASAQNAAQLDKVIAELRKILGSDAEIKSTGYSLSPNYRYPREGGKPTITGYTATNVVQVKINDLTQVGEVIDRVAASGANNINRLQFILKDEQAVRAQALGEAARKARAEAEALADALGVKIARVLFAEEGGSFVPRRTMDLRNAEMASAVQTPIEPGTIEVNATVTLTVEIKP